MRRSKPRRQLEAPLASEVVLLAGLCLFGSAGACGTKIDFAPEQMIGLDPSVASEAPQLFSISPRLGPTLGGTRLSLSGQGFQSGATVAIDGIFATEVTVWSGTLLTAKLPPRLGRPGAASVAVTNPDGKAATRGDLLRYHTGQLPFPEPIFSTGNEPVTTAVAVGDWNGDGQTDFAAALPSSRTVRFYLSNGLGGFTAGLGYSVGTTPAAMGVGDFDADGKLDLAVVNSGSNDVSILRGNGQGSFSSTKFPTGTTPMSIVVADWNGDRRPDLAIGNSASHTISVLLNNGAFGFAAPVPSETFTAALGLAAGDFDEDGKPDLALVRAGSNDVSVRLGSGNGSFSLERSFSTGGTDPSAVAVADLNRDGHADLIVTNKSSSSVSVRLGDGHGGFDELAVIPVSGQPSAVTVGAFTSDAAVDLVVASTTGNWSMNLVHRDELGRYSVSSYRIYTSPTAVVSGDLDGDQWPDLAFIGGGPISSSDNRAIGVHLLLNDGRGGFRTAASHQAVHPAIFSEIWGSAATGDLDRDGRLDLAFPDPNGIAVYRGDGQGNLSLIGGCGTAPTPVQSVAIGDWNADGKLDIASDVGRVCLGSGSGQFLVGPNLPRTTRDMQWAAADVKGANGTDFVVNTGPTVEVLGGGANGTLYPFSLTRPNSYCERSSGVAVGDFDGNSLRDVAVGFGRDGHYAIGVFSTILDQRSPMRLLTLDLDVQPMTLTSADLNRDGIDDVVSANVIKNTLSLFLGSPGGLRFAANLYPQFFRLEWSLPWVATADLNQDENLDVILVTNNQIISVFYGDGSGGFPSAVQFVGLGGWNAIGDFNADGRPDLVAKTVSGPTVFLNAAQ